MESIICRSNMCIVTTDLAQAVYNMPMYRLVHTMIKLKDLSASIARWFDNSHTVLLIDLNNVHIQSGHGWIEWNDLGLSSCQHRFNEGVEINHETSLINIVWIGRYEQW